MIPVQEPYLRWITLLNTMHVGIVICDSGGKEYSAQVGYVIPQEPDEPWWPQVGARVVSRLWQPSLITETSHTGIVYYELRRVWHQKIHIHAALQRLQLMGYQPTDGYTNLRGEMLCREIGVRLSDDY